MGLKVRHFWLILKLFNENVMVEVFDGHGKDVVCCASHGGDMGLKVRHFWLMVEGFDGWSF